MSESGPAVVRASFDGLLFDMDGTIIDSTEAVVQHWHAYGAPDILGCSRRPGNTLQPRVSVS